KRLRVVDYGRMALTVTRRGDPIGVRVILDKDKTVNYPKIHLWYMNEQKIPHDEVFDDILKAGLEIYSHEYVRVKIIEKKNKNIILCSRCDEPFISTNGEDICNYCYEGGYYELD
ncbi:MAG: FmdE family protein, partial [Halobacteriota archaeon]|nr:FmdE family protein [Halobacteriota archaeon]